MEYYRQSIAQLVKHFQTNEEMGLSIDGVVKKRVAYGNNSLPRAAETVSRLKVFFDQWKSPLIIILVVAGVVSGVLHEFIDMTVISITIGINVVVGFLQEDKANQALKKLRQMVKYQAIVIRSGQKIQISSEEIVPGDILYVEAGDQVQADGRIIRAREFAVNESVLTGESEPESKLSSKLKAKCSVGDQQNMVFRSTTVMNGDALVLVTATGEETEIGKIASLVKDTKDQKTPLQNQLLRLSKVLSIIVLFISVGIFFLGFFTNHGQYTLFELFETAIAIAVAAIPEGLVIALTVILAVGMQYILKRKALVRKLVAAETLGSVSVICVDKTGTITEGQMKVTQLVTSSSDLDHEELGILTVLKEEKYPDAVMAIRIGTLCNNAIMHQPDDFPHFVGDTTDTAIAEAGLAVGINKQSQEQVFARLAEVPFDSKKKYMATLHGFRDEARVYVKGAPEVLLAKADHYEKDGKVVKLSGKQKEWFEEKAGSLAKKGLRVLAVAYKKAEAKQVELEEGDIKNLIFVGLIALSDPLRKDVKETLDIARIAGMKVAMITGDHVRTAQAIGKEIGLDCGDDNIFDGEQLHSISDAELRQVINNVCIFARVDPRDKIRIVKAFQENGEVVAMTGDGVNDGPALKGADIGVALGSGTPVAKEISDIVLLDDKFGTIVSAVEEGRGIYQNIKKVVLYLLAGSSTEVFLITASLVGGLPLAVIPVQILWINLIEDSFPALALSFDKGDKENMQDPPRKKNDAIVDKEMKIMIILVSVITNVVLFFMFLYFLKTTGDLKLTRTIIFAGLGIDSLLIVFAVRSMRHMVWQLNPFANKYVVYSVIFAAILLVGSIYWHPLQVLLRTVPLTLQHWLLVIGFGILNLGLIELVKGIFIVHRRQSNF